MKRYRSISEEELEFVGKRPEETYKVPIWVIPQALARSSRPGYSGERDRSVSKTEVDAWAAELRALGIKSIVCLLSGDQLPLYSQLETDLISYYRDSGFAVGHIPAQDHQRPPLSPVHLDKIWAAYQALPKPVLVHCSAGIDRTGLAVEYIQRRLLEKREI